MPISAEELLSCLHEDLSDQNLPQGGTFWPGMSIREAAAVSIGNSLIKKFIRKNTSLADEAALTKFLESNSRCSKWALPSVYDTRTETLIGEFKRAVYEFWYKDGYSLFDDPRAILGNSDIGPGANLLANGGDFYTKFFSSRLSCSDLSLYIWYSLYTKSFPEWSIAEIIRELDYGSASIQKSSRLSFVPKNEEISRCICTEPTLNTYFQLGIGNILEQRLRERFGISLRDQQFKNRDLARLGSITDGLSTIDLSSASDSISLLMLESMLPLPFYRQLCKYRTESVDIKGRGTVPLSLLSTMGNGYTFPIQTTLFACAVVACFNFRGIPYNRSDSASSWGVFGDDIIVPSSITRDVIHLLDVLGFTVNSDKTFVEGPFRESCGSDFYLGTDIRGIYVKSLDTAADRYSAINQLVRFSTKTGIWLWRTVGRLLKTVDFQPVPPWSDTSSGIHYPFSQDLNLERDSEIQGWYYTSLEPRLPKIRIEDGYIVVPKGDKQRMYNPAGLLISFLQGSVRSSSIGTRKGTVKWRKKRRSTSMWDQFSHGVYRAAPRDHFDYGTDWLRWKSVARAYMKM